MGKKPAVTSDWSAFLHRQKADPWHPNFSDLEQWQFVPLWSVLYRKIRTLLYHGQLEDVFLRLQDPFAIESWLKLREKLETQPMSQTEKVNAILNMLLKNPLIPNSQRELYVSSVFHEVLSMFQIQLHSPKPYFDGHVRTLFITYPLQKHIDVVMMEKSRALPSLFMYVTHDRVWERYGYLHYIKPVEKWPGKTVIRWAIAVARELGCHELHLYDQSTVTCLNDRQLIQATSTVEFPIVLSIIQLLEKGKTWYESIGFHVCRNQNGRHAPYYLPWARESGTEPTQMTKTFRKAVNDLSSIRADTLLDPLRNFLQRHSADKAMMTELATIWSPLLAYLELFLQEDPRATPSLRDFLFWLFQTNCVVYHAFQSVWIPYEYEDAEKNKFETFAKNYPREMKPLQNIGKTLQSVRYFWIDPHEHPDVGSSKLLGHRRVSKQ